MTSIRVGTWNVEYATGVSRNERRLVRIQAEVADIWVLTETHDDLDLSPTHSPVSTVQRPAGRPGGRWATIWSRWPIVERVVVGDPVRTVAAVVEGPRGPLLVYGTVMPWGSDPGPDLANPARGWTEQDRVLRLQVAEWQDLQRRYPEVALVVAGDLNMNLGGKHYYGTARGRATLQAGLDRAGLACAMEWERVPEGTLRHPPIDHVLVPEAWIAGSRVVSAWEGTTPDGVRLSDHSGLVISV